MTDTAQEDDIRSPSLSPATFAIREGARTWSVFAVVECIFYSFLPAAYVPPEDYSGVSWALTAVLFAVYPLFGALVTWLALQVLSLVAASAPEAASSEPRDTAALASRCLLVIAVGLHLALQYPVTPWLVTCLGLYALLVALLALSLSRRRARRFLVFATNPVSLSLALLLLPWLTLARGLPMRSGVALLEIAVNYAGLLLGSFLVLQVVRRLARARPLAERLVRLSSGAGFALGCSVLTLLAALPLAQRPSRLDRRAPDSTLTQSVARPNLLMISLDTVRADHLSLYGYERPTTPTLLELSKEATLYRHAIAPSDHTLASHASLFTGLYPRAHGAHLPESRNFRGSSVATPLDKSFTTLAEILLDSGYETAGVVSNSGFLGRTFGLNQGFRYWDSRGPVPFLKRTPRVFPREAVRSILARLCPRAFSERQYRPAEIITDESLKQLRELQATERPFFLFVNYMDAHEPHIPPAPFDSMFPGKDPDFRFTDFMSLLRDVSALSRTVTARELAHLGSQYDGGIAYIDSQLGRILRELRDIGVFEDTMIVVLSDHGQHFGERSLFGHGNSVYQGMVWVPLLLKFPGRPRGDVIEDLVSIADVFPTVLSALGMPVPDGLQGTALSGGESPRRYPVLAESHVNKVYLSEHPRFRREERAVFDGSLKYIESDRGKRELYRFTTDVGEERNLFGSDSRSEEMSAAMARWLETEPFRPGSPPELSPETLEVLRGLGYVE